MSSNSELRILKTDQLRLSGLVSFTCPVADGRIKSMDHQQLEELAVLALAGFLPPSLIRSVALEVRGSQVRGVAYIERAPGAEA